MIKTKKLEKTFYTGNIKTPVLKGIDLVIEEGEFVAVMGRSGAGKSTLMYQVSLLDEPTGGEIFLDGKDTKNMTEEEKTKYRLKNLGFVFQDYALIPELTAVENVMLPLIMQGKDKIKARKTALGMLKKLDLDGLAESLPAQLSGGEQQRVSIARAIAHKPKILFADELTANLDSVSALSVVKTLQELNKKDKQTIMMITHEEEYGRMAQRIIRIGQGVIDSDGKV